MIEQLYYKDQYINEFIANIIKISEVEGNIHVILDKTAFFPGGGGQSCDLGEIDNIKVINVIEEKNDIIHVLEDKPRNMTDVICKVDWNRRFDGMQQHLAQHVLSGCFYSLFNINTCGIHLGKEISTIDLIGEVSEEEIRIAEKKANDIIRENHKVDFLFKSRKEAKKMGLRRELATKDECIRVVKIDGLDINACCGIHPSSTMQLQLIKIKSFEKHKGNTRIEFLAGSRAVNDYIYRDEILSDLCKILSAGDNEVIKTITNLNNNINQCKNENSKLKAQLSEYEIKELKEQGIKNKDIIVINKVYTNEDMRYLNKLANKLTVEDNNVILLANKNLENKNVNMLFACSKNLVNLHMGNLLKDAITLVDGKGGGNNVMAQGGGKNLDNIDNAIEYSIRRIFE